MPRPWTRRIAAVSASVAVLAAASAALSCACLRGEPAENLKHADVAFVGKLESLTPYRGLDGEPLVVARFAVAETLVGPPHPRRELLGMAPGGRCGSPYAVGQTYAILADRVSEGWLWDAVCMPNEHLVEDYVKAVRPPPRRPAPCVTVPAPTTPSTSQRRLMGRGDVVWRRSGSGEVYATRTTLSNKGLCRVELFDRLFGPGPGDKAYVTTTTTGACPMLDMDIRMRATGPYVDVDAGLSDREYRRLQAWAASRTPGRLRLIAFHDGPLGLWRNYALWVEQPNADVHLRRRGFFGGWLL